METPERANQGPFLSAAVICEKVLEEKDGVKSAIRIIDRVTRTAVGPNPPEAMEPFEWGGALLIKLKSGWARGNYHLSVRLSKPSGESPSPLRQTVYFEGEEDRGADIVANMKINFDMAGIYWFHIYLGDKLMTQIPLRVIYLPQIRQVPGGPAGNPPQSQE